jgi:preprotein translocase subunit SecG
MILGAWVYSLLLGLFITLFIIISIFLILLVLIQKGRGGGLASAFGGGGGNTAFGSKTGDVLTWATSIIFGIFLFLAVILNLMTRQATAKPPVAGGNNPPAQQAPAGAGAGAGAPTGQIPLGSQTPPATAPSVTTPATGAVIPPPEPTGTPAPTTPAPTTTTAPAAAGQPGK